MLLCAYYTVLDSSPKLKDLYSLVTPDYAAHWKVIGTLLDISTGRLDGIEKTFPASAFWCCNEMLKTWLEIDTSATWRKLTQVIDSPGVMAIPVAASATATMIPPTKDDAGNEHTHTQSEVTLHVEVKIQGYVC